jgi:hypothetical protein
MKKSHIFIVLGVMLLLFPPTSWASDQLNVSEETPAILASLNQADVAPLDDTALREIRGQDPRFTIVRLFPLNYWDKFPGYPVQETNNLLGWQYGTFGGIGNSGDTLPIDGMDYLFYLHDNGLSNAELAAALRTLPKESYPVWGRAYQPGENDLNTNFTAPFYTYSGYDDHYNWIVGVQRVSVLSYGGRFLWGCKPMPFTEYMWRQAFIAMSVLSLLP